MSSAETERLAKVSSLLDEAKDEILQITGLAAGTWPMEAANAHAKIDEAQRILLGDEPTNPEVN